MAATIPAVHVVGMLNQMHGDPDPAPDPDPEASEGARSALCGLKLGELKAIAEAEGLKLRGIPW